MLFVRPFAGNDSLNGPNYSMEGIVMKNLKRSGLWVLCSFFIFAFTVKASDSFNWTDSINKDYFKKIINYNFDELIETVYDKFEAFIDNKFDQDEIITFEKASSNDGSWTVPSWRYNVVFSSYVFDSYSDNNDDNNCVKDVPGKQKTYTRHQLKEKYRELLKLCLPKFIDKGNGFIYAPLTDRLKDDEFYPDTFYASRWREAVTPLALENFKKNYKPNEVLDFNYIVSIWKDVEQDGYHRCRDSQWHNSATISYEIDINYPVKIKRGVELRKKVLGLLAYRETPYKIKKSKIVATGKKALKEFKRQANLKKSFNLIHKHLLAAFDAGDIKKVTLFLYQTESCNDRKDVNNLSLVIVDSNRQAFNLNYYDDFDWDET